MPYPALPLTDAPTRRQALALDAADPLSPLRQQWLLPDRQGQDVAYFCGHRLGPPARMAADRVATVLSQWHGHGMAGGQQGATPWQASIIDAVNSGLADLLGATPAEVVAMAGLGTNLHLLLASFYRPSGQRRAVVVEADCFTADRHVIAAQLALHGGDPQQDLLVVPADPASGLIDNDALATLLAETSGRVALVLWPGVHWRSGQAFDLATITAQVHAAGAVAGFDLAHAVGSRQLALHDSGADFAVWCGYKHLSGGPGAPGGLFVHARHHGRVRPKLAGWWGHRQDTRFAQPDTFDPSPGAAGWQHSPPSPLALAPLAASLAVFGSAGGMAPLQARAQRLDAWLRQQLSALPGQPLVPCSAPGHYAPLTLRVRADRPLASLISALDAAGVMVDPLDGRHLRLAIAPLYTSYLDLYRLLQVIAIWSGQSPDTTT